MKNKMFCFATCDRKRALSFIQQVFSNRKITDTSDSAKDLLDFVEKDIVRIQVPLMHGDTIEVIQGKNWEESQELKDKVIKACNKFHSKEG